MSQNLSRKQVVESIRKVVPEADLNALHIRIFVNQADSQRKGMVSEEDFVDTIRNLTEDMIEDSDLEAFQGETPTHS